MFWFRVLAVAQLALLARRHLTLLAPDERARTTMMTPDDVARAIAFVLDTPATVRIDELVLSPSRHP